MQDNKPTIFNVKNYGAKGDGRAILGSMSASGTTFTSTTSVFSAADIGKYIKVAGADVNASDLVTKITAFTSATIVTVQKPSFLAVSSVLTKYGTDDTQAIQAAENARFSNGDGTVWFPLGKYIIAGPLQTSIDGRNPNSQLYIHFVASNSSAILNLQTAVWEGETATNLASNAILNVLFPENNGVILISFATGSGTYPSVFATGNGTASDISGVDMYVKNISVLVIGSTSPASGPSMCGLNFASFYDCNVENVSVSIDLPLKNSVLPTRECFGIMYLRNGSGTFNAARNVIVQGFKYGHMFGEHFNGDNVQAMACVYGICPGNADHASMINRAGMYWCNYPVASVVSYTGAFSIHRLKINELSVEADMNGSNWWHDIHTIYDPSNFLAGTVQYGIVRAGVGYDNSIFSKQGGTNYTCAPVDAPFPGSAFTLDQTLTAGNSTAQLINITGFQTTRSSLAIGGSARAQNIDQGDFFISENIVFNGTYQYVNTAKGSQIYFFNSGANPSVVLGTFNGGTAGANATVHNSLALVGNATGGAVGMGGNISDFTGVFTGANIVIDNTTMWPVVDNTTDIGKSAQKFKNVYAKGIVGTSTNDNATAGNYGEYMSSGVTSGNALSLSNNTAGNLAAILLTAGDWDVEGLVSYTETSASITSRQAGITSTSATIPVDGSEGYDGAATTTSTQKNSITIPRVRMSITGNTTVFLVAKVSISAGTCAGFGNITARRIR